MQEILRLMRRLAAELAEPPVPRLAMKSGVETVRSLAVLLVEPSAPRSPQIAMNTTQEIMSQSSIDIMKNTTTMTSGMRLVTITLGQEFREGIYHRQANVASGLLEPRLAISRHREAAGNSGIMYLKVHGSCVGKAGFRL
jgi:hypothetical protein